MIPRGQCYFSLPASPADGSVKRWTLLSTERADDAARVALSAVRSARCSVQEVRFALYTDEMRDVFATVLAALGQPGGGPP